MLFYTIALVILAGISSLTQCWQYTDFDLCPVKIEPLGCYHDKVSETRDTSLRTLKTQRINARDPRSKVFFRKIGLRDIGVVNWRKFNRWLPNFICECAKIARRNNDSLIGIQHFGECWTGNGDYAAEGESTACLDSRYGKTFNAIEECKPATGVKSVNYVYRVAPTECAINYKPVGCYKDLQKVPRPLPDYLMNERDYSLKNWNQRLIQWQNWKTYNPGMICRCAEKAKQMGFDYFGIQFWGECWGGRKSDYLNFRRDGITTSCADNSFTSPCPCNSYHCVGKAKTNYVYELI